MTARKRTVGKPTHSALPAPPIGDPVAELSPTGRRMLAAAQRVLARDGFTGLTLEALQEESGMNKSAVWYHFGGKPGLIAALVDLVEQEESTRLLDEASSGASVDDRVAAFVGAQGHFAERSDEYAQFFELLPHILRDDKLRANLARQMEWYRQADGVVLAPEEAASDARMMRALSALTVAVEDGLAIQHAADPEYDLSPALELWTHLIRVALDEVQQSQSDPQ